MRKTFFFIVFIIYSLLAFADPNVEVQDFTSKGMNFEQIYDLGYSSKVTESAFAVIVYNPSKDERGIVIVNKTRKRKM